MRPAALYALLSVPLNAKGYCSMAMLPGWNSLESVGSIGHSLHMAAIVVLALLVVAEGLALVYDDRKYALVGAAERETIVSRDQEGLD